MAEREFIPRPCPILPGAGSATGATAVRDKEMRMLTEILAARWLGHGRAVECALALAAGLYGVLLLIYPEGAATSAAMSDFADYGRWFAAPLLIKAGLTGGGLILNIRGAPYSGQIRWAGGCLGSAIWCWLIFKFSIEHAVVTAGFCFSVVAALFSIRIMGMARAGLPRPGAPGAP